MAGWVHGPRLLRRLRVFGVRRATVGWQATARRLSAASLLPSGGSEMSRMDVMAFADGGKTWLFPTAVIELENCRESGQDRIFVVEGAVRAGRLRVVFCYRKNAEEAPALIQHLRRDVIDAMSLHGRVKLEGRTFVVVGSSNDAGHFPLRIFQMVGTQHRHRTL